MRLFVTGINGFIGTHLLEAALASTDWEISGLDLSSSNLAPYEGNSRFSFRAGDIFKDDEILEAEIIKADAVLPLAGIAKPAYYIKRPVWTFELDFEQNLKIVRLCAKHGKRVIFPSTSEVYGMSEGELREDESRLVVGPISKTRWIYSCSKQMMDRMIFAYGQEAGLSFSIFRPFNWIGPRLDTFRDAEERTARSVTQMLYDMARRRKITLVNGGAQRRSFTWVGDGVEGLMAVIRNEKGRAEGEIFNIGNPDNNYSMKQLAGMLIEEAKNFPVFREAAEAAELEVIPATDYYGANYDDMENRVPSVQKIERRLGWRPKTGMREMLRRTIAWHAANEESVK
ncbi:bifunctional UDP-4-keto-pentose/UDP-xylose synthase [Cloacibacillus sp. An23]|uniref:bifunctional UDP-4-keto-pentose/UDP-xylose synthase n=1 Tax=Cloacibacillus sp. An23 TaxID=1965591 RepID=UPI000B382A00|nr:bifunctional UDP-4-keto-pentose/UDP-xylose synthase [Cloacibacillus sp. An23]OUO93291.1 NAD-dependent epimerase/dehydratase family protein [Cloacibacillus sp. An23]